MSCDQFDPSTPPGTVWYFAIGSMINPVSLSLRDLKPIRSYPAACPNWKLVFKGTAGMASIARAQGECMHGVVHLMTLENMQALDQLESIYDRCPVDCRVYAPNDSLLVRGEICATAYVMDESKLDKSKPDGKPSERYLDIITRGCVHYGVDKDYIKWLNSLEFKPRKKPSEFSSFPVPPNCPIMLASEVSANNGDGDLMYSSINGKVLKCLEEKNSKDWLSSKNFMGGKDITLSFAKNLYEPKYPIVSSISEMSAEHRAHVEDMLYGFDHEGWEVVGLLRDEEECKSDQPDNFKSDNFIDTKVLPDTEWYFAIGSMINPVSVKLRDLTPIRSYPACCPNWKLVFVGQGGFASIEKDESSSLHGVLHLMSRDNMSSLDKFESSYNRRPVLCRAYLPGQSKSRFIEIEATAYVMDENKLDKSKPPKPPSERYLDIILKGCAHFGVDADYVTWLQSVETVPRKNPTDYSKFIVPSNCPVVTPSEVASHVGDGDDYILMSLNGKVLKFIGERDSDAWKSAKSNRAGKDSTVSIAKGLYEPRYPIATCIENMSEEQRAFIEDIFYGWAHMNWEVVGLLPNSNLVDPSLLPNTEWYFAIGSMINPVSLSLRDLSPIRSYPAACPGYQLVFKGMAGMASIDKVESACMHGVVHLMTKEQMAVLDKIESGYNRAPVKCFAYLPNSESVLTEIEATAYIMDETKIDHSKPPSPPSERYIDIITRGCVHFGVSKNHISWLGTVSFVPRKNPSEFCKFPVNENLPLIKASEVAAHTGENDDYMLTSINGKVLKFVGERDGPAWKLSKSHRAGTLAMARGLYEPRYPIVTAVSEMSEEHKAHVEDMLYTWGHSSWTVVGLLEH